MTDHISYLDLTTDEKDQIHDWLIDHGVDYHRVPVHETFDFDQATGEWRIPLFWQDTDGRMRVDETGEDVRRVVVRRRELRPLPWPRPGLRMVGPVTSVSIGGVDVTPYVSAIEFAGQRLTVRGPGGDR